MSEENPDAYFLGVDIGTTSVKAVAYGPAGAMIRRESAGYQMSHPLPDRSEQDPEEIARATAACINAVVAGLRPALPDGVAFSSAMHSLMAVDAAGRPLTPCIIYADNRAAGVAETLHREGKAADFYRATGVPVHAMSPLCKLLWLRQEQPRLFHGAAAFIGIKEYVFSRLFGRRPVDSSIASATGLLNQDTLDWDDEILRYTEVDHSKLGQLVSPREVLCYQPAVGDSGCIALQLPAGTPIVIGCSDGACANLATGAAGEEWMAVTIGTSGAVRMIVDAGSRAGVADVAEPREGAEDPGMRTFRYHVRDGLFIRGGASNNGAVVLQWLREQWLATEESYEQLFAMAAGVPPGADGLLLIPYILGERAPVWNPRARGIFFGIDIRHGKAHQVRAAMEGVIYSLYTIGETLMDGKRVRALHATGGFARSPLWLQILADVFQLEVWSFGEEESAALGAVMVGREALRLGPPITRAPLEVYRPEAGNAAVYRSQVERFKRLYRLVESEFRPGGGEG